MPKTQPTARQLSENIDPAVRDYVRVVIKEMKAEFSAETALIKNRIRTDTQNYFDRIDSIQAQVNKLERRVISVGNLNRR